jgi:hypothetical protein
MLFMMKVVKRVALTIGNQAFVFGYMYLFMVLRAHVSVY